MNYYERNMGDYARDASHLSMLEHGAYTLLLDRYYTTEQPIPEDQTYRLARATTRQEKAAVDAVLREFFTLTDGVWVNRRASAEIEKAQAKINAARANGARGGRPSRNPTGTQQEPSGFTLGSLSETQSKALQTPDTRQEQKQQGASTDVEAPTRSDPVPIESIVAAYNATMERLPKVRVLTAKRRQLIRSAWQAAPQFRSLDFWRAYFAECADDNFLNGTGPYTNGHENWRPDLDYLLRQGTVAKVFERAVDRSERAA